MCEQLLRGGVIERLESNLQKAAATAPFVPILGTKRHQHERSEAAERISNAVEQLLRPFVDPVKVFEQKDERCTRAQLEEHRPHRIECALTLFGSAERLPFRVIHRQVEQSREGRECRRESWTECGELCLQL